MRPKAGRSWANTRTAASRDAPIEIAVFEFESLHSFNALPCKRTLQCNVLIARTRKWKQPSHGSKVRVYCADKSFRFFGLLGCAKLNSAVDCFTFEFPPWIRICSECFKATWGNDIPYSTYPFIFWKRAVFETMIPSQLCTNHCLTTFSHIIIFSCPATSPIFARKWRETVDPPSDLIRPDAPRFPFQAPRETVQGLPGAGCPCAAESAGRSFRVTWAKSGQHIVEPGEPTQIGRALGFKWILIGFGYIMVYFGWFDLYIYK